MKIEREGGSKAQIHLPLLKGGGPGLTPMPIGVDRLRRDVQVLSYTLSGLLRGGAEIIRRTPQGAERAYLEGKSQTLTWAALFDNSPHILSRQGKKGDEIVVRDLLRKAVQLFLLSRAQHAAWHLIFLERTAPDFTKPLC